jgi:putative hydrolase of the HAD superfamily
MQHPFHPNHYKSILFDLGGVLLNIDYQKTKIAFENLGINDFNKHFSQLTQSKLFNKFETGAISPSHFRNELRKEGKINSSDDEIDAAWNAMLLDFPLQRLELLESLAKQAPIYLFSNTNKIHIDQFHIKLKDWGIKDRFENVFTKIYYSYAFKHRKPHPESFLKLLEENDLRASETLFIDDSLQHIEGAKKTGLQSFLLDPNLDITNIFKHE